MTGQDGQSHQHPPITGADGELVDLFIELLDRKSDVSGTEWWDDHALMAFRNFTLLPPRGASRELVIGGLREMIERILGAGLNEAFLVRALITDLDAVMAGREDTSRTDRAIDDMREHLQRVIEDSATRDEWRQIMARQDPKYLTMTDEQMISDSQGSYDRFATRYVSADEAAERWTDATEWRELRHSLLTDVIFEHWNGLNIQRGIEGQREED
jgi:hypothetical protein